MQKDRSVLCSCNKGIWGTLLGEICYHFMHKKTKIYQSVTEYGTNLEKTESGQGIQFSELGQMMIFLNTFNIT